MRTVRLTSGDIQITMSEVEARGCYYDLRNGDDEWLERIESGLEGVLDEEDDDEDDFDGDDDKESTDDLSDDDDKELSS